MKRLFEVVKEEAMRDPLVYTAVNLVALVACYALYQDIKGRAPWYLFVTACIIGLAAGLLVVFVMKKIIKKMDSNTKRLFRKHNT